MLHQLRLSAREVLITPQYSIRLQTLMELHYNPATQGAGLAAANSNFCNLVILIFPHYTCGTPNSGARHTYTYLFVQNYYDFLQLEIHGFLLFKNFLSMFVHYDCFFFFKKKLQKI